MSEKIGFIGLGVMGRPMASHLASHVPLTVYDLDPEKTAAIPGATPATTVTEVGQEASYVLLSLLNSKVVEEVTVGPEGLLHAMPAESTVIDLSTTEPAVSRSVAQTLATRGIHFLDAPVSGGEGGAKQGELAIMAGGDPNVFKKSIHLLNTFAKSVVHLGPVGAGGVTKLANNMIVASTFATIAEAFALAQKNGLDCATVYHAIKDGWAASPVLDVAARDIISGEFNPGGTIDMLLKDMHYALNLAEESQSSTPMTSTLVELNQKAQQLGLGQRSQAALIQLWTQ